MFGRRLVVVLLCCHLALAQNVWNADEPFQAESSPQDGVNFESSSKTETRISIDEGLTNVRIAQLNYVGDVKPEIKGFEDSKSNEDLGAEAIQDGDLTWHLVITKPQDYETPSQQNYRFTYDIGSGGTVMLHRVAMNIIDIDDSSPSISGVGECIIEENLQGPTTCDLNVFDADAGRMSDMTYKIMDGSQVSENFVAKPYSTGGGPNTAKVYLEVLGEGLDYEQVSLYILQVYVTDGAGHEGDTSYIVKVKDMPDEPPFWKVTFASLNINELEDVTKQVEAADGDVALQIPATIQYKLDLSGLPEEHKQFFSIDLDTGLISIKKIPRDDLKTEIFKFDVIAFEKDDPSSLVPSSVIIIVEDINNNSPTITPALLETTIDEETYFQLELDINIKDPDLGLNGQFSISLEDSSGKNLNELFLIVPTSGYQDTSVTISVTNAPALDYENPEMRVVTLQLVAIEVADVTHVGRKDVVITLRDLNDEVPIFNLPEEEEEVHILENVKKGTVIFTTLATDADEEDKGNVIHSITSGDKSLSIDQLTGVITVTEDNAFDYETQTQMIIQVLAEDLAKPTPHRTYARLTINVDDVNDTPPVLVMPPDPPNIEENSIVGTPIHGADITASDRDQNGDLSFYINWDKCSATKQGARVSDTALFRDSIEITTVYDDENNHRTARAELTVKEDKLNYEEFDILVLNIVVEDRKTELPEFESKKETSATLTIIIDDENDCKPEFTADSQTAKRSVLEMSNTDQLIGSVIAIDKDGPGNNEVTYSINPSDPNLPLDLIKIDKDKGEIRVDKDQGIILDGTYDALQYEVIASDGELQETLMITIEVIDTNNNYPQVILPGGDQHTMLENTDTCSLIMTISNTDGDYFDPYKTVSYLLDASSDPKLPELFSIDVKTGELWVDLKNGAVLDRDEPNGRPSYAIKILLRDNYQQGNTAVSLVNDTTITLNLQDVNDNAPVFDETLEELVSPSELTTRDTEIAIATAKDVDYKDNGNGLVTYELEGYDRISGSGVPDEDLPEKLFGIKASGEKATITVLQDLTNLWGVYDLHLLAKDSPQDSSNQSITAKTYKIVITDVNNNKPIFQYPQDEMVIRLRLEQEVGTDLYDAKNERLPLIWASDLDDGLNAEVTFNLVGTGVAMTYFGIDNDVSDQNKAKLILKQQLDPNIVNYELKIDASDKGSPSLSNDVTVSVRIVLGRNVEPTFNEPHELQATFMENTFGTETFPLPTAVDQDNFGLDESDPDWNKIFYYIVGSNVAREYFEIDVSTTPNVIKMTKAIDREEISEVTVLVVASNNELSPPNEYEDESLLTIQVTVGDENDSPPVFEQSTYSGGIAKGDKNGQIIIAVKANDPDLDDPVKYSIISGSMVVSDSSLDNVKDRAFTLNPTSGELKLEFDPDEKMVGYFTFRVQARDSFQGADEGHTHEADVKVFLISASNRVTFKFRNSFAEVDEKRASVTTIFSEVIGFTCAIDSVVRSTDSSGAAMEDETDVTTHYIDPDKNEPVESSQITVIVSNRETMSELKRRFFELPLELIDYDGGNEPEPTSIEGLLQIVLIVVSVVLGTLVILLFAAFFIKTRSLNRRLEALSTTKFGSQDSGLNRVGLAVPNTNKHAVEGSNPVWNEDIADRDYDNVSQGSDDSDLIGVEDRPEFETGKYGQTPGGSVNAGYQGDGPRRPSINPLSVSDLEHHMAPRLSINPMSTQAHHVDIEDINFEDDIGNPEHSNFSFGAPLSIPVTEL